MAHRATQGHTPEATEGGVTDEAEPPGKPDDKTRDHRHEETDPPGHRGQVLHLLDLLMPQF